MGVQHQRGALSRGHRHLTVLRDDAQQGQAGGVHGVVDGGAQLAHELWLHPVYHQMNFVDPGEKLRYGALGVPQGGGVGGGDDDGPVRRGHGQLKAVAQPGGGVHKDVVEILSGLVHHPAEAVDVRVDEGQRGGEQIQPVDVRVLRHGGEEGAAQLHHVGEVHERAVVQPQRDVQIPQADVQIDAQHPVPQRGQTGGHARRHGGFTGPALAGRDHDGGSHSAFPPNH